MDQIPVRFFVEQLKDQWDIVLTGYAIIIIDTILIVYMYFFKKGFPLVEYLLAMWLQVYGIQVLLAQRSSKVE